MTVFQILECDGCGKRVEIGTNGEIRGDQDQAAMLAITARFGNIEYHVCSYNCASKALEKACTGP